nr:hypothetical protein CFP56_64119 [Quercus suber]
MEKERRRCRRRKDGRGITTAVDVEAAVPSKLGRRTSGRSKQSSHETLVKGPLINVVAIALTRLCGRAEQWEERMNNNINLGERTRIQ